jgi:hypothetical protein
VVEYLEPANVRDTEKECILEPGSYLIVPKTFGTGIGNITTNDDTFDQFLLSPDNTNLSSSMLTLVHDLFKTLLGPQHSTHTLPYHSFKPLYEVLNPDSVPPKSPNHLTAAAFATAYPDGLTIESFRHFFFSHLTKTPSTHDAFRSTLQTLGYHPSHLLPTRSRRFNLSLHYRQIEGKEGQLSVMARDATDTRIDRDVTRMLVMRDGTELSG